MKDGRILGGEEVAINQLLPIRHQFAWDAYKKGLANNWVPTEISMQQDIQQWRNKEALSEDERFLIRRCLGFFAGAESLVGNNLLLSIFKYVTDADCRQYIIRQAFEESLHNLTVIYICESLALNQKEIYEAYINIPAIRAKDEFLMDITREHAGSRYDILKNIITYYLICEGIFFYSGFAMLLNFGRQNKMTGIAEQIQYTIRDESVHLTFGVNLINTIKDQEPKEFDIDWVQYVVSKATELEIAYAHDVLPNPIVGISADMFIEYIQYIADRRLQSIGLRPMYNIVKSPFPWLSETIDLTKNKNFFETRVIDYQQSTLKDDLDI